MRRKTLLLARPIPEAEATVVAHLKGIIAGMRVRVATATGREDLVIFRLRGGVEGVIVVAVSVVTIFVALLILGAGVVLAVVRRRESALPGMAMVTSRTAAGISADTRRGSDDILSVGLHALVEGGGETFDVITTVTLLFADVSRPLLAVLRNRAEDLAAVFVVYGFNIV